MKSHSKTKSKKRKSLVEQIDEHIVATPGKPDSGCMETAQAIAPYLRNVVEDESKVFFIWLDGSKSTIDKETGAME